jgi:hypothetical protein
VIIELLSDSTAKVDKGLKKDLYQNQFRTSEYFWFSPNSLELAGWRLTNSEYKPIPASENAWYWSQELGLYLGIWEDQLRYFTVEGRLVPTPEEANLEEIRKAETERQRADRLAEKLRSLGVDPDSVNIGENDDCADGEPVAETYTHLYAILTTLEVLKQYLAGKQATVLANQFLYYAQGCPRLRVASDVMVIFDVPPGGRDNYKVWEEGQVPQVIFEMKSRL